MRTRTSGGSVFLKIGFGTVALAIAAGAASRAHADPFVLPIAATEPKIFPADKQRGCLSLLQKETWHRILKIDSILNMPTVVVPNPVVFIDGRNEGYALRRMEKVAKVWKKMGVGFRKTIIKNADGKFEPALEVLKDGPSSPFQKFTAKMHDTKVVYAPNSLRDGVLGMYDRDTDILYLSVESCFTGKLDETAFHEIEHWNNQVRLIGAGVESGFHSETFFVDTKARGAMNEHARTTGYDKFFSAEEQDTFGLDQRTSVSRIIRRARKGVETEWAGKTWQEYYDALYQYWADLEQYRAVIRQAEDVESRAMAILDERSPAVKFGRYTVAGKSVPTVEIKIRSNPDIIHRVFLVERPGDTPKRLVERIRQRYAVMSKARSEILELLQKVPTRKISTLADYDPTLDAKLFAITNDLRVRLKKLRYYDVPPGFKGP